MSTEFKLYNVDDEDLYRNKSPKEKFEIRKQMIVMAKERGIKPTARYFNTYPATVRRIIRLYNEKGEEGLITKKFLFFFSFTYHF